MKEINVRKLEQNEHGRTRKLWEKVFTEDTQEFLDYYYSEKVKDNEIYVIEDNGDIVSMVHLNPYRMRIDNEIQNTHYIVAVATDENYRRKGLMATLLHYVMDVMQRRGEPFTFLMPASESIYKPFGFTFIYTQNQSKVFGLECKDEELEIVEAALADCDNMAEFANEYLQAYEITTWRTAEYYKMILSEQKSQNGGILLLKRKGIIEGIVCYAKEEEVEIREPLVNNEESLKYCIFALTGNETDSILCIGFGKEIKKPMIMAKAFSKEMDKKIKNAKVFINEVV